jgi:hypothetical protein
MVNIDKTADLSINAKLLWQDNLDAVRNEVDYFYLLYPMDEMPIIIQHTNDVLRRDSLGADTNKGEMLQWHGIRLCMAVEQVYAWLHSELESG